TWWTGVRGHGGHILEWVGVTGGGGSMPFQGVSVVEQRAAFVARATEEGANVRGLCREYGISPTTGYQWLRRAGELGPSGLADRPRRPHRSPGATAAALVEEAVA